MWLRLQSAPPHIGLQPTLQNRFADLKYCMHFLQVQLLFSQRKEKAALIAVDARIRDAEV